jgi:hypothetical protein
VKIGAEDKNKLRVLAVCGVAALLSLVYWYRSSSGPTAAPSTAKSAAPAAAKKAGGAKGREITLDPTLRTDILLAGQKVQYEGSRRNIFRMQDPPPPPPPPPSAFPVRTNSDPPPPPPKPPITLKFYGFSSKPGEPKRIFLSEGDEIFVAREGDIVNRRYKIHQITATSVLVEDMLNDNKQQIPLTAPPPAG